jgi:hypothetical protein
MEILFQTFWPNERPYDDFLEDVEPAREDASPLGFLDLRPQERLL